MGRASCAVRYIYFNIKRTTCDALFVYVHMCVCERARAYIHTHMMHLTQIRVYKCSSADRMQHGALVHNVTRHLAALFILPLAPNMY